MTVEVVRSNATSVEKARFGTRARRLAAAEHPSLIKIIEIGPTHCVLEAPSGMLLAQHAGIAIARARQKLSWMARAASVLAALHKAGIVHGQLDLDAVVVLADGSIKVAVAASGNVSGSPLDDLQAYGLATCQLMLGEPLAGRDEKTISTRLADAGLPLHAAAVIARVCAGRTMTSEELADELAPFAEFTGPTTEPLVPVVPRR